MTIMSLLFTVAMVISSAEANDATDRPKPATDIMSAFLSAIVILPAMHLFTHVKEIAGKESRVKRFFQNRCVFVQYSEG
jgi:hypothetical protein